MRKLKVRHKEVNLLKAACFQSPCSFHCITVSLKFLEAFIFLHLQSFYFRTPGWNILKNECINQLIPSVSKVLFCVSEVRKTFQKGFLFSLQGFRLVWWTFFELCSGCWVFNYSPLSHCLECKYQWAQRGIINAKETRIGYYEILSLSRNQDHIVD